MSGWDLPPTWAWTSFSAIASVDSNLVQPSDFGDYPHIAPNHIESQTGRLLPYQTVSADGVTSAKHHFRSGHIIYSKIRPYLAKAVLVDFEGLCSADAYPVSTPLEASFLHRWMLTGEFTAEASRSQGRTVLPKINKVGLAKLPVPVAPLNEQRRIVAKIDALQARSRRAREALDAIPALLERFRQSVLAAAFRGDLTADWRAANPHVEPASELLKRIRAERRSRWIASKAETATQRAEGRDAKKGKVWTDEVREKRLAKETEKAAKKYTAPEPVDPEKEGLPELPEGWCWARFDDIGDMLLGRRRAPEYRHLEVERKYLRVANVKSDRLDLLDVLAMRWDAEDVPRFELKVDDILISEGQSLELIGQSAMVDEAAAGLLYQSTLHRLRTFSGIRPRFAQLVCVASTKMGRFARFATITTNIAHLPAKNLKRVPFPIPPSTEQFAIEAAVDGALGHAAVVAGTTHEGLAQLDTLDQAILAKAFRGELVPQNPNDEPASELLKRIKAERETRATGLGRKRRRS